VQGVSSSLIIVALESGQLLTRVRNHGPRLKAQRATKQTGGRHCVAVLLGKLPGAMGNNGPRLIEDLGDFGKEWHGNRWDFLTGNQVEGTGLQHSGG